MSFTDMMSSGRGPGVIGMIMALFVLVGFGLLFMFAFDEGFQGGELSIEGIVAQQAKEIQRSQESMTLGQDALAQAPAMILKAKEFASLKSKNQGTNNSIGDLKKAIEDLNSTLALLTKDLNGYKNEYRAYVRGKAKGEERAKLETKDRTVYEDVLIRDVSAIGIQIRHRGGQKRIAFEDLSEQMQDYFQYDPTQKAEAVASENAVRAGHEAAVAVTDEQQKQLLAASRAKEVEASKIKAANAISAKTTQSEDLEDRIENMEEAIELEGKKRLSRAGIMTVELANMRRQLSELRAQIVTLEGQL